MDIPASDPASARVAVEHEGPSVTRWEWVDRDGTSRTALLAHLPGGARLLRAGHGPMEFPVGRVDDARALEADMALAERIDSPDGTTVYRPERVLLTVGDGATFPFEASADWHARIRALAELVRFGPNYRRPVLEALPWTPLCATAGRSAPTTTSSPPNRPLPADRQASVTVGLAPLVRATG